MARKYETRERRGKKGYTRSNNKLDESRTIPNRYTSWTTMKPPQKRGVMRNPRQRTPNPASLERTFKVVS